MHLASNTIFQGHEQATGCPFPMAFNSDISNQQNEDFYFRHVL